MTNPSASCPRAAVIDGAPWCPCCRLDNAAFFVNGKPLPEEERCETIVLRRRSGDVELLRIRASELASWRPTLLLSPHDDGEVCGFRYLRRGLGGLRVYEEQ